MAIKVNCPSCEASFNVADTLSGKKIRCRECEKTVLVSNGKARDEDEGRITDRKGRPAVAAKTTTMRKARDEDDDRDDDGEEEAPRSRRKNKEPQKSSMMPIMLIGGGVAAAAVVGLVLFLVLGKSESSAKPNATPVAQNPMPMPMPPGANPNMPQPNLPDQGRNPEAPKEPDPKKAEPEAKPEPEPVMHIPSGAAGERVYQRLLKSAVWILADLKVQKRPGGGIVMIPDDRPAPPQNNPPPQGTTSLAGTTWNGSETLAGYGQLAFTFNSSVQVVMTDKDGKTNGSYSVNGNNVSITFPGNIAYSGTINGDSMSGSGSNPVTRWTWTVTKGASGGGIGGPGIGGPGIGNPGGIGGRRPSPGGGTSRPPTVIPRPGTTKIIKIRVRGDAEELKTLERDVQLLQLPGGVAPPGGFPLPGGAKPPAGFPGGQAPGGVPMPPGGFPGGAPGGFPKPPGGGFPGGQPPGGLPGGQPQFPGGGQPQPPGGANPGSGGGSSIIKSSGTGSLVDRKHRLVLTNVHVVGSAEYVTMHFPAADKGNLQVKRDFYLAKPGIRGKVVMREQRADIALVQLDSLPEGVQVLAFAKKSPRPAQQVHSMGNPGVSGALWIYSPGKVRQVFHDKWKSMGLEGLLQYEGMRIETDSPINPGDSGGPLVDDRGVLVGVAHATNMTAQNLSIFIDVTECRMLMEKYFKSIGQTWVPEPEPIFQEDMAQLPMLVKRLNHKDFSVRLQAAQSLGKMGAEANLAFEPLFKALKDSETSVRRAAGDALDRIPPHRGDIPMLCEACKDAQEPMEVRLQAIRSLALLGAEAKTALPVLAEQLKAGDENLRQSAFKAILTIGPDGKDVPLLTEAMKTGNGELRKLAVNALVKLGPESKAAVPALIAFMKNTDKSLRVSAAQVLEAIGPGAKSALPALAEALKDTDHSVALDCLAAFLKLGGETKDAISCLAAAVRNATGETRKKAIRALGKAGADGRGAANDVINCLDDDDLRADAQDALVKITKPATKQVKEAVTKAICQKMTNFQNAKSRQACIETLVQIGHVNQSVAQALTIVYNRDPVNRQAALEAMQRLQGLTPGANNPVNPGGTNPGGINPGGINPGGIVPGRN